MTDLWKTFDEQFVFSPDFHEKKLRSRGKILGFDENFFEFRDTKMEFCKKLLGFLFARSYSYGTKSRFPGKFFKRFSMKLYS